VYWFSQLNSKNPWKLKDKKKREVILYCGPSNKSVDVVAGTSRFVFWGTSICVKKKLMDLYACVGFYRIPAQVWRAAEAITCVQQTDGDAGVSLPWQQHTVITQITPPRAV